MIPIMILLFHGENHNLNKFLTERDEEKHGLNGGKIVEFAGKGAKTLQNREEAEKSGGLMAAGFFRVPERTRTVPTPFYRNVLKS